MEGQQRLRLVATAAEKPPRLLDLLSKYEDYLIGEQRRPQGRARYLWAMRRFLVWLGEEATHAELHAASVQLYKEHLGKRGCAGATVINALAVIRDFSEWSIFIGLRFDDPTAGIRRPPKKEPSPNPLYPDEIATLMAAIEYNPPPRRQPRALVLAAQPPSRAAVSLDRPAPLRNGGAALVGHSPARRRH